MSHKFDPANLERLLREERAEWQSVERFLELLRPEPGKHYADIGCGPGYFTLPVAKRVRPGGKVYAIDIEPQMLEACAQRAKDQGIEDVVIPIRSTESRIPLGDQSVDAAWLANVFHELEAPVEFLREVGRILRPGGRLILIDWKPIETPAGPPIEHRVPLETLLQVLREAGFDALKTYEIYPYHHVVEAIRARSSGDDER